MASHVRAALVVFSYFAAASMVRAGDMCPAPPKHTTPPGIVLSENDHLIHIDSDDAMLDADGHAAVNGRVTVRQDARTVAADSMNYDYKTGKMSVKGGVDFEDPKIRIKSDTGIYDTVGGAEFDKANFQILDRNGRGVARELTVHPDGRVALAQVRYTTCPVGNEDWMLQASSIDLDTSGQEGSAHHVLMRFKNVPIFYTPYISFPMGDERKSGLLFPSFGHSGTNGYQLEVPYYFNLAPNYDLTLSPGILSARGIQLGAEFRYLTAGSHGQVEASFLPDDRQRHFDRNYFHITDTTDFETGLRFDADVATVSDSNYFSDFAVGSEQTSVTFLERRAEFLYYDDVWRIRGQLQNFQTIDILLYDFERPYSRVPRVEAEGLYPVPNSHLEFALNAEATNFVHERPTDAPAVVSTPTGVRLDVSPEIRWSNRGAGYFFEPAVGYHFTQYDLQNAGLGAPSTPTRSLPYGRLDAGLVFERDAGAAGQRTQTLEPRMVYSYVPYRNQTELPIFDTAVPDLNLTELFRTNRYVGDDRIGDANQLAVGLTTRLFDHVSGAQYLSATVGQIRYFSIPRVTIPEDILRLESGLPVTGLPLVNPLAWPGLFVTPAAPPGSQALPGQAYATPNCQLGANAPGCQVGVITPGQIGVQNPASDIVGEIALTGYKHLSLNLNYQWNPYTSHTDKEEIEVQYRPDSTSVVNVGYRFQQGILRQYDGSFAWPIGGHWNAVGRWVYSLADRTTIEQIAGFEYKSCCYRIQVVQRRYLRRVSDGATAGLDTSIALQLELTGLSSVGKPADAFLQKEIRGYTARDPANREIP
jgi:LPS-assembly protein